MMYAIHADDGPNVTKQTYVYFIERDMAQWLERDALTMSLSAARFRSRLVAGFSEKNHVSPLSILRHCFDVVSLGKALHPQMLHLTQVKMSTR